MFITYTKYFPNINTAKAYNGVTSFASGYGSVRLICQVPDGRMETIILQEMVHLPGLFILLSQFHIMDKDVKLELVNHYILNLYNWFAKSIATAPQVDGILILNWALGSTEYTDIEHSCLQALKMTGHASQYNAEKRMWWHHWLAHIGLKALMILPMITESPKITEKCNCESCIKCKLARQPFTPPTSRTTEHLQFVHTNIRGPLETAIGEGHYMLLFIDDATWQTDHYILKYKSEALEIFREGWDLREKQSGKQVKRFRNAGGCEYTSKKFAEYQQISGKITEMTTPDSPESGVSKGAIFGTGWYYRSAWERLYHIKNRQFSERTAQLSPPILIREFSSWYVNYAALHGASFGSLRISIFSKLDKRWCKNVVFGRKITVFSKQLAEFWRYAKSETTKRCAMKSYIIHVPSAKLSDQYWWT